MTAVSSSKDFTVKLFTRKGFRSQPNLTIVEALRELAHNPLGGGVVLNGKGKVIATLVGRDWQLNEAQIATLKNAAAEHKEEEGKG